MKKKPVPPVEADTTTEGEDVIPVPSKGYNMDFLDQLDDPNFNPFETKTAVKNNFEDSKPVIEASTEDVDNATTNILKEGTPDKRKKKLTEKIWIKIMKKRSPEKHNHQSLG
eukprot:TRINITY_DN10887_c0_g1_i1.p1 TRINITY_DN10887_c0_g1~~TRINITY_DN10887_c0_g1_i1.p1  ORF type:complete len:112 (-),score=25.84 TRINITY_DN10887_c0_g1_i1:228-563(-)